MSFPKSIRYVAILGLFACAVVLRPGDSRQAGGQETDEEEYVPEPTPPKGQTYVGTKNCAACHFDQYLKWRDTKHSKSFELLPANYQTDATCLKCHTTGYGHETGYKTSADTHLQGTSCEACHGPGSAHEAAAKQYANQKLTPEQETEVRDTIWKILPRNACISCHTEKAHKGSQTPPELRKKD